MPTIERHDPVIYWVCPYCSHKCEAFTLGAVGHLIADHSPSTTTPTDTIRGMIVEGDEEDTQGERISHYCPFCEATPYIASFNTTAELQTHLTNRHGCS